MDVDRRALRLGVAVAGVGALAQLSATVALFVLDVPVEPTGLPVFGSWSWDAVANWAADTVTGGMLLVAPVAALYAAFPDEYDATPVVWGFAVGALLFGVGVAAEQVLAAVLWPFQPAPATTYVRIALRRALSFGVLAALGAFAGDGVGQLFGARGGEDGQHPRW
jgi:hypothetical protein